MQQTISITPDEILEQFNKLFPTSFIELQKPKRFPRVRAFFRRKTVKICAIVTYWAAETAALVALAFSAPSLSIIAAFSILYLYGSYVFLTAIAAILMGF